MLKLEVMFGCAWMAMYQKDVVKLSLKHEEISELFFYRVFSSTIIATTCKKSCYCNLVLLITEKTCFLAAVSLPTLDHLVSLNSFKNIK